jgi:hypothetical protein
MLDDGASSRSVIDVVGSLVGVQAQDQLAAALSIRARGPGLTRGDVEGAWRDGSLVLMWSLRGTRHYHLAGDVRWLLNLLGPVFATPGRRARQLGIAGEVGDKAVAMLCRRLASDGPLTRPQVKEFLAPYGVDPTGQAPIHILHRAALEGLICMVPGSEGEESYVLLDDWVPKTTSRDVDVAAAELAHRYLRTFAPATPADFAAWSGLPRAVVNRAWASIAAGIVEVASPTGTTWLMREHASRLNELGGRSPVRMVGGFDTILLGYADRRLHLAEQHARSVNAGGGLIRPVVLDDGRVVATWALRRRGRRQHVEITPFGSSMPDTKHDVDNIARFLNIDSLSVVVEQFLQPVDGSDQR